MKINEWKKSWKGKEMDQFAREEKRYIKKKKVRDNRRACKRAMHDENYDDPSVMEWDDLDAGDRNV